MGAAVGADVMVGAVLPAAAAAAPVPVLVDVTASLQPQNLPGVSQVVVVVVVVVDSLVLAGVVLSLQPNQPGVLQVVVVVVVGVGAGTFVSPEVVG